MKIKNLMPGVFSLHILGYIVVLFIKPKGDVSAVKHIPFTNAFYLIAKAAVKK